jgi:hypothetical protein
MIRGRCERHLYNCLSLGGCPFPPFPYDVQTDTNDYCDDVFAVRYPFFVNFNNTFT